MVKETEWMDWIHLAQKRNGALMQTRSWSTSSYTWLFLYVHDILVVYNVCTTNTDNTLTDNNTSTHTNTIHHWKKQQTKLFRPNHHKPTEAINYDLFGGVVNRNNGFNCFYFFISFQYTTTCFGPYGPSSGGIYTATYRSYYAYKRSIFRLYNL
jgi:hypothetical protein